MTTALPMSGLDEPLGPLPKELAAIMRPELPSLMPEIWAEIRNAIPHYAHRVDEYGPVVQFAVEQSLAAFVDKVTSPNAPTAQRDKVLRRIGRFEAYEGHSLDDLHATFRLGARVALRRAKSLGRRYRLSPAIQLAFADALFAYVEELISVSREGYLEAKAEMDGGRESHRRRLLRLLLSGTVVSQGKISELAELADWPLPDEVTAIAISPGVKPARSALGGDALVDLTDPQPHLLIPGGLDDARRTLLDAAPAEIRAAVGLTVRTTQAADSLRWARQALNLVETGVIEDRSITFCEDHLVTLWLVTDTALAEQLAIRQLAPLSDLTPTQRERLIDTLRAWLATRGNAVQMAELLHIHPQTVRYRLRLLDRAFGDRLGDLDHRFATEVALRALQLRERTLLPPLLPRAHPQT
ncbi:helix-turn-helix domain-containing protein [Streptomyces sp. B1866]|uniref:PucR family transcriptional regulator n=1 Tax=Streptomyces sp. B1866 TaxID=3075431 RepID=UPI00288D3D2F|nr:helix-turn-helix domain-containing protein [Streptomyces sp. B1866]MDT3397048.1 helix-turn-helix domain-containing protein [Streptomyces sp. B1866]